jgi:hypothetical protein
MRLERCGANAAAVAPERRASLSLPTFDARVAGKAVGYADLLWIAPYAIAAVTALADAGHQEYCGREGKSGRGADSFREVLFNNLAWFHFDMFGRPPETERTRGARDGRSVEWAQEVLLLAAEKIPPVLIAGYGQQDHAMQAMRMELAAINEAAELATATVGDRLAAGASFVRRHTDSG